MNHKNFILFLMFFGLMITGVYSPHGTDSLIDSTLTNSTIKQILLPQPETKPESHKITLKTRDGLKRRGILTITPNAIGNVVLCHPASRNKEYMEDYAKTLFPEYNHIRFDFRRHGEDSKDQYSTIGNYESNEVFAAVKFLKKHEKTKNLPIYGFGISMGAAALIKAESKKHMFSGLILQSCYERLKEQVKRMFSFYRVPLMDSFIFSFPVNMYAKAKYKIKLRKNNLLKEIKKIKIPIFLIHAKNDAFISFDAFGALKKAAGENVKQTWTPEDGQHTAILKTFPQLYSEKCKSFLNSLNSVKERYQSV